MVFDSMQEIEKYILDIPKFVKKNTTEDTAKFYAYLGYPGKSSKVIHVAGTNGKGSICAFMSSILRAGGNRVGMFISPHLVSVRERIRVDEELISEEEFIGLFTKLLEKIENYREISSFSIVDAFSRCLDGKTAEQESYHPSYFEFLYFLGMLYFEEKKPDFIMLETGLGGRLDATNSFPNPVLSIITRIGLDHTEYLGETIREIAGEKAGIIKSGSDVVYLASESAVVDVMETAAKKANVNAFPVDPNMVNLEKVHEKGIDFSFYTGYYKNDMFYLETRALYQRENAALCLQAVSVLGQKGILQLPVEMVKKGFREAFWEGRMEEILPDVFLDGAHNGDGIRAFIETVQAYSCQGKRILLFSVVSDKDYKKMAEQLMGAKLFDKVLLAPLESSRGADMNEIAKLFEGKTKEIEIFPNVEEGFISCIKEKKKRDQVYVAGSLYLVGQIKEMLKGAAYHDYF